jgi:hypothetical protein
LSITIHKALIPDTVLDGVSGESPTVTTIPIPPGFRRLLSVGLQPGPLPSSPERAAVWYLVDALRGAREPRMLPLALVPTGASCPDTLSDQFAFLGTLLLQRGRFVLHVFADRLDVV